MIPPWEKSIAAGLWYQIPKYDKQCDYCFQFIVYAMPTMTSTVLVSACTHYADRVHAFDPVER